MKKVQTIKCQIESCLHNGPDHYCELKEIRICPCAPCGCSSVAEKEQSMCADFHQRPRGFF